MIIWFQWTRYVMYVLDVWITGRLIFRSSSENKTYTNRTFFNIWIPNMFGFGSSLYLVELALCFSTSSVLINTSNCTALTFCHTALISSELLKWGLVNILWGHRGILILGNLILFIFGLFHFCKIGFNFFFRYKI